MYEDTLRYTWNKSVGCHCKLCCVENIFPRTYTKLLNVKAKWSSSRVNGFPICRVESVLMHFRMKSCVLHHRKDFIIHLYWHQLCQLHKWLWHQNGGWKWIQPVYWNKCTFCTSTITHWWVKRVWIKSLNIFCIFASSVYNFCISLTMYDLCYNFTHFQNTVLNFNI